MWACPLNGFEEEARPSSSAVWPLLAKDNAAFLLFANVMYGAKRWRKRGGGHLESKTPFLVLYSHF